MEMNNSVFYKVNSNSSCFANIKLKRVFSKYYPDGFDVLSFGENAGIAQQYLFYYERWQNTNLGKGRE